jgi:hypothetical protein
MYHQQVLFHDCILLLKYCPHFLCGKVLNNLVALSPEARRANHQQVLFYDCILLLKYCPQFLCGKVQNNLAALSPEVRRAIFLKDKQWSMNCFYLDHVHTVHNISKDKQNNNTNSFSNCSLDT